MARALGPFDPDLQTTTEASKKLAGAGLGYLAKPFAKKTWQAAKIKWQEWRVNRNVKG